MEASSPGRHHPPSAPTITVRLVTLPQMELQTEASSGKALQSQVAALQARVAATDGKLAAAQADAAAAERRVAELGQQLAETQEQLEAAAARAAEVKVGLVVSRVTHNYRMRGRIKMVIRAHGGQDRGTRWEGKPEERSGRKARRASLAREQKGSRE